MIINIQEGESQEDFIKRVRDLLPPGTPPSPPGWDEIMEKARAEIKEEQKEDSDGDS